ncbi:MAG: helix-turn-helix domain-containing protein [Bacteroidales bacterium]|nr:helix-turn-helix domain-containing protein [Bacteroidales bacterium]
MAKRELLPEDGQVSSNLRFLRENLLGMGRREVFSMTGVTSGALQTYENPFSAAAPTILTAKKLCDLYGVDLGALCESDFECYGRVSSEAERILIRSLRRFGGVDSERYANEACDLLGMYAHPLSRWLMRAVTAEVLKKAVGDMSKNRPVPVTEDSEICVNLSRNIGYLTKLCSVTKKKISAATGIPAPRIASALTGDDVPLTHVIRYARYFSVPLGELVIKEPDFGDERVVAGNVALGVTHPHVTRPLPFERAEEFSRETQILLGREDADKIIFDTFSELEK